MTAEIYENKLQDLADTLTKYFKKAICKASGYRDKEQYITEDTLNKLGEQYYLKWYVAATSNGYTVTLPANMGASLEEDTHVLGMADNLYFCDFKNKKGVEISIGDVNGHYTIDININPKFVSNGDIADMIQEIKRDSCCYDERFYYDNNNTQRLIRLDQIFSNQNNR